MESLPKRNILGLGLLAILTGTTATAAEPAGPDLVARVGKWALPTLEKRWPDHPEWLAMFADILAGSQLGKQAKGPFRLFAAVWEFSA